MNEIQKAKAEKNAIDLSAKLTPFEAAAFSGDLAKLAPEERGVYLLNYCQSMGINPLSGAIQFLMLDGRLVIYATKSCTQQLAARDNVTVITSEPKVTLGVLMCEAKASRTLPDGTIRTANNVGAVPWDEKASPKDKCSAIMKVITKAERRVILSICGLGIMDETELDTIEKSRLKRVAGPNFDVYEDEPGSGSNSHQQAQQRQQPPRAARPFEKELLKEKKEWMAAKRCDDAAWAKAFGVTGKTWGQLDYKAVLDAMLATKNVPTDDLTPPDADIPAFSEPPEGGKA